MTRPEAEQQASLRADKWLWQARFFKSRSLAATLVQAGHLRINGNRVAKPAAAVRVGDTLTFAQADRIRVVRILGLGHRRGPAAEAQALYDDLTEAAAPDPGAPKARAGRPGRDARRAARAARHGSLE